MNPNDDMDEVMKWANNTEKKRKQERIKQQDEERNKGFFSVSSVPYFNILALAGVVAFVGNVLYTSNSDDTVSDDILPNFQSYGCATPIDE